jgi:hypothetical protein
VYSAAFASEMAETLAEMENDDWLGRGEAWREASSR